MMYFLQTHDSAIGKLYLLSQDDKLCALIFESMWPRFEKHFTGYKEGETPVLFAAKKQIDAYLSGDIQKFDLLLHVEGTLFEKKVWTSLLSIPYGQTRSYKEQAAFIETPGAARAVGRADGRNRLCLIFPCHRVIGSNGSLTGYAGGIEAKRFLLQLEAGKAAEMEKGLPCRRQG